MTQPVSDAMFATIRAKLDEIAKQENAKILLAIESGSRAWGFHSPDSDYDVRFIYTRNVDWHLTVTPGRDVIERPISDELDLSGWDLAKTLGLIMRSNAVALEWLNSPITYGEVPEFRADLLAFATDALRRKPMMWHYLRLAERQYQHLRDASDAIRLKRYFYVIRPVLALRWMRLHADLATPPMHMDALLAQSQPDADAHEAIITLTTQKKSIGEMGTAPQTPAPVNAMIEQELALAKDALGTAPPEPRPHHQDTANALLRKWVRRMDPTV